MGRAPEGWRRPGFQRPLAGLLFYIAALLLLTGPFLFLTAVVVPSRVQPFPEVDGSLIAVDDLLLLGWAVLDFGITTAVIRACASLRNTDRSQIVPHLRLLLRWQLRISCVISAAGVFFALCVLPHTRFAQLSLALLMRSCTAPLLAIAALPALCEAVQRYDRQLVLELLDKRILSVLFPIPCVLILRGLSFSDEASRALIGVAIGQGASLLVTAGVGVRIIRRLGLPLRALMSGALPPTETRSALLRFGAGIMAGKAIFFIAGLAELSIVATRLADFSTWLGVKSLLLGRLLQPMWLLWPFCETAMPSVAEALSAKLDALAKSYVGRYLALGHLFVATLFALAWGSAPPLISSELSAAWQPAADLVPLAGLTGLLLPLSWIGDAVQRAAGHSGRNAGYLFGEQVLRLSLLAMLLPRFGLAGLFVASAIAAASKTIAVLIHVHRRVLPLDVSVRSVFAAPLFAAFAVGSMSRMLVASGAIVGVGSMAFLLAAALAFPLAFLVTGLVGGWEPSALLELDEAKAMVPLHRLVAPVVALLAGAAKLGARLGPHTRDSVLTTLAIANRGTLEARFADSQPNRTN